MSPAHLLRLEDTEDGQVLRLTGDWRLSQLILLDAAFAGLPPMATQRLRLDGSALTGLDSAAAMVLIQRLEARGLDYGRLERSGFDARRLALLDLVAERLHTPPPAARQKPRWLMRLGGITLSGMRTLVTMLAFVGQVGEALGEMLVRPARLRPREFFVQLEVIGLEAIAIVGLMTFLVGVVFAHLLATQIEKYGANIFIVDGVSMAVARELAPMLTAILVAGRSGAAFTAQIGAMKVTEEIDAINTLGLSPFHVLVLPRLLAIVIAMPLLTFIADLLGLLGAAMIADQQLDISFFTFFTRLKDVLPLDWVLYGLYKAPAFAAAIALIACRNGFAVSRDARSVGERTTTTVVQSLVAVILINAAFALASPVYRG